MSIGDGVTRRYVSEAEVDKLGIRRGGRFGITLFHCSVL